MSEAGRSPAQRLLRLLGAGVLGALLGLLLRPRHPAGAPRGPAGWLARLQANGIPPAAAAAILIWVAFSAYWSWAAANASPAASAESRRSRLVHLVIIGAGQILVLLPVPGLRARLWPAAGPVVVLGLAVDLLAFALAVWARRTLGRHWSGEITVKVDHELVTDGPYAHVRHPIYTAMLVLCAGTTLVWGQVHALVGTVLVGIAYVRKIRLEERALAGNFGPAWEAYRARTRAIIPGLL